MTHPRRLEVRRTRNAASARGIRAAAPLAAALLVAGGLTAWSLAPQEAFAATGRAAPEGDFNGDGYADLVSGAPGATVSHKAQAGYVAVTYGSANGLVPSHKKLVSRSTSGVPGSAAAKQRFGETFSKGDLDGDGYSDLVIGAGKASSGSVILWGSPSGLTGGTPIATYGQAPQVGDFDGDGKADLALFGDPGSYGDDPVVQAANLWKGPISRTGSPAARLNFLDKSEWFGYDDKAPGAECAKNDSCVSGPRSISGPVVAKATGDVNGDHRQDIVMWNYAGDGEWDNKVLLGGRAGFKEAAAPGVRGTVGVGDVDGDGYGDVVAGDNEDTGKVTVAYGTPSGPSATRTQSFDQGLPGFHGAQESGDRLGSCVAVADVTGDGRAEIALGISGEDFSGLADAGSIALLHGTASGVTGAGSQVLHQNTPGVPGVAEKNDAFGAACGLLDVNGDGHRDLAVSSAAENASSGAVWSLRGSGDGLTTKGATAFGPGDVGGPVTKAEFGIFLR
ncbi:FG-GAP-like repeat-containing protein [Streptomyces nigrescens]